MHTRFNLLIIMALTMASYLLLVDAVKADDSDRAVIVLFGDSTTTGYNSKFSSESDRFANGTTTRGCPTIYLNLILQNDEPRQAQQSCPTVSLNSPILDAVSKERNAIVSNWGVGGSTTSSGLSRITANLTQSKNELAGDQRFVLIMYGTNDRDSGISTTTTQFNISQMISRARNAGFVPIIGTITPRDDYDVSPYNAKIVSAANQANAPVVDHFARFIAQPGGWRSLIEQEVSPRTGNLVRLHPNDHGYLTIAETWFDKALEDLIEPEPNAVSIPAIFLLLDDD